MHFVDLLMLMQIYSSRRMTIYLINHIENEDLTKSLLQLTEFSNRFN